MIAAIHQPHYMPWLGYLDKMAQADCFIILDKVQLTDQSPMLRNKFLEKSGRTLYMTVETFKKHYHGKKTNEIEVNNATNWQRKHENFFLFNYNKHPYFKEIWPCVQSLFHKPYERLIEVEVDSIMVLRELMGIKTPILFQSGLEHLSDDKSNDLLVSLCRSAGASIYLSGNGARAYLDIEKFESKGIRVGYQKFSYPPYPQINNGGEFVPNLSALDILFNCGIDASREILRTNQTGMDMQ